MAVDMDVMLARVKDRQWALADIDWDAPGAEMIRPELRPKLTAFMADLCWIENIGARGFAAMARKAPTATLAEIYRYFHAEEQRHANAQLALMKRWGMLDDGDIPEPNVHIRLATQWLDRYSDGMPLSVLGTVIPMLEVTLDGALLRFLLDEVDDPVCHQVFEKINSDESRHIAVDFEVLEMIGHRKARKLAIDFVRKVASPGLVVGVLLGITLFSRVRDEIIGMGLDPERFHAALMRFQKFGDRGERTRRIPSYRIVKRYTTMVTDPASRYHRLADPAVRLSARYPKRLLKPVPSWFNEITYHPVQTGLHGLPEVRGADSYAGQNIHAAEWRGYDFTGKRVGVVDAGTGVFQIVPELVKRAESVTLFQRAPSWVLPRQLFAGVPVLARQLARVHLRLMVKDPWLRRQLTPSPAQDCRHIVVSRDYYPALQRDNCKLIDWPIARLCPAGIRTSDGVEHRLDAIVFADETYRCPAPSRMGGVGTIPAGRAPRRRPAADRDR